MRSLGLSFAAAVVVTSLAFADPEVRVTYPPAGTRIALEGDWHGAWYTVWRGEAAGSPFLPITSDEVLCIGECFALDTHAEPGRVYLYRFDLVLADGSRTSFGPYAVIASPNPASRLGVRVAPNPGRGAGRIELAVPGYGAPVQAEARLYDAQGRSVRLLHRGPLPRGITTLTWDGRDDRGRALEPGLYFLRLSTPGEASIGRVVRRR
jgi:hypothetical protein